MRRKFKYILAVQKNVRIYTDKDGRRKCGIRIHGHRGDTLGFTVQRRDFGYGAVAEYVGKGRERILSFEKGSALYAHALTLYLVWGKIIIKPQMLA